MSVVPEFECDRQSASESYVAYNIKSGRHRRTKAEMNAIKAAIIDVLTQSHPQTVRQDFYALTVKRVIDKRQLEILKVAEESERGFLKSVAEIHAGGRS